MAEFKSSYTGEEIDAAINKANDAVSRSSGGYVQNSIRLGYTPKYGTDAVHKGYVDDRISKLKDYLDDIIKTYHPEHVPANLPEYGSQ